jgi:hypothetical protein
MLEEYGSVTMEMPHLTGAESGRVVAFSATLCKIGSARPLRYGCCSWTSAKPEWGGIVSSIGIYTTAKF